MLPKIYDVILTSLETVKKMVTKWQWQMMVAQKSEVLLKIYERREFREKLVSVGLSNEPRRTAQQYGKLKGSLTLRVDQRCSIVFPLSQS